MAMDTQDPVLSNAVERNQLLGTREFFLRESEMIDLLQYLVSRPPGPVLSLNQPHAAGRHFIHRAAWLGLTFVCVSLRPLTVS
jgi:hypothetical protein